MRRATHIIGLLSRLVAIPWLFLPIFLGFCIAVFALEQYVTERSTTEVLMQMRARARARARARGDAASPQTLISLWRARARA